MRAHLATWWNAHVVPQPAFTFVLRSVRLGCGYPAEGGQNFLSVVGLVLDYIVEITCVIVLFADSSHSRFSELSLHFP